MAESEFKCSPHLLNRSSHPLVASVDRHPILVIYSLDEPTFVLVVDHVQRIRSPGLLDLLDEFFQRHLTLSLRDDLFDKSLVSLEIQVVHLSK